MIEKKFEQINMKYTDA